jgi:hypothetical protein
MALLNFQNGVFSMRISLMFFYKLSGFLVFSRSKNQAQSNDKLTRKCNF